MKVLVTLRFLASGSFLQVVGNTFLSFDKSTVSRVVHQVTKALSAKLNAFIKFPSTRNERDEVKRSLFRIGGTHVRIKAPSLHEPDYVNRKGFHSINLQAICNHEGKH